MSESLQSAQQSLAQAGQEAESAQNGQGKQPGSGQKDATDAEMGQEFGSGGKSGKGSKTGQGGKGGKLAMSGGSAQGSKQGKGQGKGGGMGGPGQGMGGSAGPQDPLPGAKVDSLIPGMKDPKGKQLTKSYMDTPDPKQDQAAYYSVAQGAKKAAEASLNREEIPAGHKKQVRDYFDSLQKPAGR